MAHGRYSYIAVGKEAVKGQKSNNINTFLKFSGGGFNLEKENIESKALTGRLLKYDTAIGTRHWAGSVEGVELDAKGQGLLFKSFFSNEAVSGSSGVYTHTFTLQTNPNVYTSLTFEQYKTEWLRYFVGSRVIGLTFKGELNSIMTVDADIISTDYEEGNPVNKKNVVFGNNVSFRFYETTFKINNTPVPIKSFEVAIKEGVEVDYNFLGGKKPTGLLRGGVEGSISFDLNLSETSLDFWAKMLNENDVSVEVEMKKNNDESLKIIIPRCRIINYEENDGDEILTSDIELEILSATNDSESVKIELKNDKEEEY